MENIHKKIELLKDFYKVKTDKELASKLGISAYTINTWKQRKKLPSKIELLLTQNELNSNTSIISNKNLMFAQEENSTYNSYKIQKLNLKASAGSGIEHFEVEVIDNIAIPKNLFKTPQNPKDLKIIEVDGDSMEPTLKSGDLVIVNTNIQSYTDGIYAIVWQNSLMIKRLQFSPDGTVEIISDNAKYKNFSLSKEKIDELGIKIFGKKVLIIC